MADYDLVFEGGGAKGSSFVGALQALSAAGHNHRRLVGTSAGAITATLLAAGYRPEEMLEAANERLPNGKPRFSSFMDPPAEDDFSPEDLEHSQTMEILKNAKFPGLPTFAALDRIVLKGLFQSQHYRQLFCFVECGGLFSGNAFVNWLQEKLEAKGIDKAATFGAFADQTKSDLSLVASDTSAMEMLVLNRRTAPECPVAWAVRMSMSIPFVWREVEWQRNWGKYLGMDRIGHKIVDGGVLSNFPIRLIDVEPAQDPLVREVMGDTVAAGAGTLGLLIDETRPVTPAKDKKKQDTLIGQLRTVQRVSRLVDTMTRARDNADIRHYEKHICRLPARGYGTTEFDMDPERLKALIDSGRKAMEEFLAAR
jgi:NTE family protein